MARKIIVSGPVLGAGPKDRREPISFGAWAKIAIEAYPESGHGFANIETARRLLSKLSEFTSGEVVLDEADWKFLRAAVESMSWSPTFILADGFVFVSAVKDAPEA